MGKIIEAQKRGNNKDYTLGNTISTYREAEQMHRLKDYYVPYHTKFINNDITNDTKKANIYVDNGQQQITITYTIPEQDGMPQRKENIVIATGKTYSKNAIKSLERYIQRLDKYQTVENINPQLCIAELQKQEYTITPEGLDVFLTDKLDENMNKFPKEIKRTVFTQNEKENKTHEQIKENRKRHIDHREKEVIASIGRYILDSYKDIKVDENFFIKLLTEEQKQKQIKFSKEQMKSYVKRFSENYNKVMKYSKDKKDGNINNDKDSLDYTFRNMKPIRDIYGPNRNEEGYIKILEDIIQTIPKDRQDENQESYIEPYFKIRKALIKIGEKEDAQKYLEEIFIETIDMNTEEKYKSQKDELLEKARKIDLKNNITPFPKRGYTSKDAR